MLQIDQLQKHYKTFSLHCSLEVPDGRITGLVGQNGAGKTTLFKAILGLIRPDGGSISLLGKDPRSLSAQEKQELGVALATSGFNGYLTVADLLPLLSHFYATFDRAFFLEQAEQFHLPMKQKIREFSSGMKAKLKILCAISHDARLLILDEPTAGLDVVARESLLDLLRTYMARDERRSMLISSHISSDLESLCDDFYMIHQGGILLHEDTDVLLSDYALLKIGREQYQTLDKRYLLRAKPESFGYSCLTNQKQYYLENYPQIAAECGSIDHVISMMVTGTPAA
ncbi:MAG: ABC transporter ATP-binding protein [Eubacteriales bacterium]|nr:ABC transporter ATP-binding protein [Eubacteriales bacterium]